jgi:hypothetical protein
MSFLTPALSIFLCSIFAFLAVEAMQSGFKDKSQNLMAGVLGVAAIVALAVWWPGTY